jgi:two-component system alkaline phosphatase synthesis response regulator PhoP
MNNKTTVLIVDDNDDNLEVIELHFELLGYRVVSCTNHEECFEQLKNHEFSAIVLDVRMQEKNGFEICREIRVENPDIPIIFFTADATQPSREMGKLVGADAYLLKPEDFENVVPTVAKLIEETRSNEVSESETTSKGF